MRVPPTSTPSRLRALAIRCALSVLCLPLFPALAHGHGQISGRFSVDNGYQLWIGNATQVTTLLASRWNTKADSIREGKAVEFTSVPDCHIYVVAWSDTSGYQGLLASFTGGLTRKTGDPQWRVWATQNFLSALDRITGPAMATLNGWLPNAIWTASPVVGPGVNSAEPLAIYGPMPTSPPTGFDPDTKWIWHDSGKDSRPHWPVTATYPLAGISKPHGVPFLGFNHDETLIFRVPCPPPPTDTTDLSIHKEAGNPIATVGQATKFYLTVAVQQGSWNAPITIIDVLPASLTLLTSSTIPALPADCGTGWSLTTTPPNIITCTYTGPLPITQGTSFHLTIPAMVAGPAGDAFNCAHLEGTDAAPRNDSSCAAIKIVRPASGTICVKKFNDLNGNGTQDTLEPGLPAWNFQVQLGGQVVATATTGDDGVGCVSAPVAEMPYNVVEIAQSGWTPTTAATRAATVVAGRTDSLSFGNRLCGTRCATPPVSMVSWWSFEESSGTTVSDSWGGNTGVSKDGVNATAAINGSGPGSVTGQYVGNALAFTGAYVEVAGANLRFGLTPFSIDAWVRVDAYDPAGTSPWIQPIVDKLVSSAPQAPGYALFIQAGKLRFVIKPGGQIGQTPLSHPKVLTVGWHHVAVSVARPGLAVVTLYVDGVPGAAASVAVDDITNNADVWLGRSRYAPTGTPFPFKSGAIDELEIFNEVLTPSEVESLFKADTLGKCKPRSDLGDAPDSTNHFSITDMSKRMRAYPPGGPYAQYPTVYDPATGNRQGPLHRDALGDAWLGDSVTLEREADRAWDAELTSAGNNIQPQFGEPLSIADKDASDDGIVGPIVLPAAGSCGKVHVDYKVRVVGGQKPRYVNVWFDFNRDGDWADPIPCIGSPTSEWAVRNETFTQGNGTYTLTTADFDAYLPASGASRMWMRITLTDEKVADANGAFGSGPAGGYAHGETEDHLIDTQPRPGTAQVCVVKFNDANGDGVKDAGEAELSGWIFQVTDATKAVVATDTTRQGQSTCFDLPAPAAYSISEVPQAGWIPTIPSTGSQTVTLTPGQSFTLTFGNRPRTAPRCDLVIRKGVSPSPLANGQQATATLTLTNVGDAPCPGPTPVTESVPPGLTLLSATGTGWTCSGPTCTYATPIPVHASLSVTYTFNVTAKAGAVVGNCAIVNNPNDTNAANNRSCVTTPVVGGAARCDLAISKRMVAIDSQKVSVMLTLQNVGSGPCAPDAASIITVQDPAIAGLAFPFQTVTVSQPGWNCGISTTGVSCQTSTTLQPSSPPVTITFTGFLTAAATSTTRNCAIVTFPGDANATNNQSCVTVPVSSPPLPPPTCDLSIRKSVAPSSATTGQAVTITLNVVNTGRGPCPAAAGPSATVRDNKVNGLTLSPTVSVNPPGWTCALDGSGNLSCNTSGALPAGYQATFTFTATVTGTSGAFQNCASVSSSADANSTNNSSCVTIQVAGAASLQYPGDASGSTTPTIPRLRSDREESAAAATPFSMT